MIHFYAQVFQSIIYHILLQYLLGLAATITGEDKEGSEPDEENTQEEDSDIEDVEEPENSPFFHKLMLNIVFIHTVCLAADPLQEGYIITNRCIIFVI